MIRSLLEEYRACLFSTDDTLTLSEALDPPSVGTRLHQMGSWGALATGRRREIIDAYLALCRSNEEIAMLEQDARNCVAFYEHKKQVITCALECQSVGSDLFSRGATALLTHLMHQTSQLLNDSIRTADIISHQQTLEDESWDTASSTCSDDSFDDLDQYLKE